MQLLQNGKQQFIDQNGAPLANGSVYFYAPGTTNPMPTYQDPNGSILNTNPVVLDSRGQAVIWGSGSYRQVVKDCNGVTIWDQITRDANASLLGSITDASFVAGADFTPGTSTSLTLPVSPGSTSNLWVFFDSIYQDDSQIASIVGTALTFAAPIPVGVSKVSVKIGTTIAVGTPGAGTVGDLALVLGSQIYNRKNDTVSVTDFGAVPGSDASAAFNAAAQFLYARGGGRVFIPAGKWQLASTVTSYANVEFIGEGEYATVLAPTTANMTLFSCSNATLTIACSGFRDFTVAPTVAGVTAISLVLCRFSKIENINFAGCATNVYVDRGSFIDLLNLTSEGVTGLPAGTVTMTSTSDTDYVYHSTITNYKLVNQGTGVPNVGIYLRRAIDFQLTDIHAYGVTGCNVLIIENDSQAVKVKGLNVDGCASGVTLRQGSGVAVLPSFTSIANSHIDQPTAYGIQLSGAIATTLTDVMFTPNASYTNIPALFLIGAQQTIVQGCVFSNFGTSGGAGIQFSASDCTIIDKNIFLGCYVGIGFSGTPTNTTVGSSNIFQSTANPIAGSVVGTGNRIAPSINGLVVSTSLVTLSPAMPATGVAFTNTTGFTCRVFIEGGTFSIVAINGINVSAFGNSWSSDIQPGEAIAITYTVAPSWWWVGK